MECKNAYTKDGINYILCRRCAEPAAGDIREICHAMCGFQRFCPNMRACTLLPGWPGCTRLRAAETAKTTAEGEERKEDRAPEKNSSPRGGRKKSPEKNKDE